MVWSFENPIVSADCSFAGGCGAASHPIHTWRRNKLISVATIPKL